MIEWRDVSVRYPGASTQALSAVSFTAQPGTITAVVGPNGSGKSTLVRALLRRVDLAAGQILVNGTDVASMTQRVLAQRVAVVVQREEPAFPVRVRDYIALGRTPHSAPWGHTDERDAARVAESASLAGIPQLLARFTDALSGGEWQRVRIARAIAQDAESIVLDEPTTFLDVAHEMAAFELLADLAHRGHAVVVVSHQLNLVSRFADRIVLVNRGAVVADGTPGDVMRASVLESVYEWPLVVSRDPAVGAPTLVPLRKSARPH